MASIVKRKRQTKKGEVTKYYISYRDIYGKQHTTGGYKTLAEARKHINDYDNIFVADSEIKIKDIFDLYAKKLSKKALSTQENFEMYYKKHFKPIEHLLYKKTTIVFWQNFFDEIEAHSPSVAEQCLKYAKASANNAIQKNLIQENKFLKVDKIKPPKADINHLTKDESLKVLEKAKEIFPFSIYVLFYTFLGTGMRVGEILGLNKEDVDIENLTIRVNKQFSKDRLLLKPKTDSSNRFVHIFPDLAKELKKHIKTLDGSILFPNSVGNYMNVNNFRNRYWNKLKKELGITKRVRIHDLRGTYIDLTLSSGLSPKFTQNNVGHSRNSTTMDIYARNNQDMVEQAQEVLNNVFEKCCTNVVQKNIETKTNVISFLDERLKRNKKEPFGS